LAHDRFRGHGYLVQNDIKRTFLLTCSQLGYMFVAMGVCAYSVGMFHLLPTPSSRRFCSLVRPVIVAMHHEQDIRHMGGLKDKLPFTYWTMLGGHCAHWLPGLTAGISPRTPSSRRPMPVIIRWRFMLSGRRR
jgi:NADH-quinone oxidoreductase subunit L